MLEYPELGLTLHIYDDGTCDWVAIEEEEPADESL